MGQGLFTIKLFCFQNIAHLIVRSFQKPKSWERNPQFRLPINQQQCNTWAYWSSVPCVDGTKRRFGVARSARLASRRGEPVGGWTGRLRAHCVAVIAAAATKLWQHLCFRSSKYLLVLGESTRRLFTANLAQVRSSFWTAVMMSDIGCLHCNGEFVTPPCDVLPLWNFCRGTMSERAIHKFAWDFMLCDIGTEESTAKLWLDWSPHSLSGPALCKNNEYHSGRFVLKC